MRTQYNLDLAIRSKKWDRHFLDQANLASELSKDPSSKVGAVLVDSKNRLISSGYNGFPYNISDDPVRYEDKELKHKLIIHAEMNAILFSGVVFRQEYITLYTYPFQPCERCAVIICQVGISRVVTGMIRSKYPDSRWILEEADIKLDIVT